MRPGLIGFILGVLGTVLALLLLQHFLVAPVVKEFSYRIPACVFDTPEFPSGDLVNGRALRRALLPVHVTTTFYDAGYHEVKQADHPGRYGTVVRIDAAGVRDYRFITLYRTPKKFFWGQTPFPIATQLPPGLGLDPAVLRAQSADIGNLIAGSLCADDGTIAPNLAILLAGLSETPPGAPPAVQRTGVLARDSNWWDGLRRQLGLDVKYRYLLDFPQGYSANDVTHRWPLILYLGKSDDRGDDLGIVRVSGLAGLIHDGNQLPAIVVTPQCPADQSWDIHVLSRLLDEIAAKYPIDPDRVYVTGISSGGDLAWQLGLAYPDRFAAIVPICGDTDPADAARLRSLPVWAFHGIDDPRVPVRETTDMIAAIRQAGGHPHMTLFPGVGHPAWIPAYATEALYPWLFAQKRGQPEVLTPGVP